MNACLRAGRGLLMPCLEMVALLFYWIGVKSPNTSFLWDASVKLDVRRHVNVCMPGQKLTQSAIMSRQWYHFVISALCGVTV